MSRLTDKGRVSVVRTTESLIATREPSRSELRAIEAEWALIAAEVAAVDAESAFLRSPGDLTAFRLARAERALRRLLVERRAAGVRGFGGAA